MELKKHISFKKVFFGLYALIFAIYIIVGLQPAEATNYEVSAELEIPSISLYADVTTLNLEDYKLKTPDYIVGSFRRAKNKTLLIGHSSTVFGDLEKVKNGDLVVYDETNYKIEKIDILEKDKIKMGELLAKSDVDTLVIMTCAGEKINDGDATHRLIVTATIAE